MADAQTSPQPQPPSGPAPLPSDLQSANASKDDRTMAMIAHLLGLVGFLGPLILYLVKKDTASRYVQFHMKQAMWFQIAVAVAYFALFIISIPLMYVCVGILTMFLAMGVIVGAMVYAIIGAIKVNGGNDFEYYYVGPWVRKSL